jgi:hypothetical protein
MNKERSTDCCAIDFGATGCALVFLPIAGLETKASSSKLTPTQTDQVQ